MRVHWFPFMVFITILVIVVAKCISASHSRQEQHKQFATYLATEPVDTVWRGWNKYQIPTGTDSGRLIRYGYELVSNTAYYLGPRGTVMHITNGMNCQNCHLAGGTLPFGNNFGKVYANYPQFRARCNSMQTIYDRINDCLERSLNGTALDSTVTEMKAIHAYIQWLGEEVPKNAVPGGTGIMNLPYLDRAADPIAGAKVYITHCQHCHGANGEGQLKPEGNGYTYPPLWGANSYNDGAGLYRLSNFAGFVKNNMPFGTDYHTPQLTNEQAWDLAAFVNSRPRPHKDQHMDWKNIAKKPVDFPFGPYIDTFSEKQHKYGPFKPIRNAQQALASATR